MIPEELFFINFPPNVLVIFRGHVFPVELTEKTPEPKRTPCLCFVFNGKPDAKAELFIGRVGTEAFTEPSGSRKEINDRYLVGWPVRLANLPGMSSVSQRLRVVYPHPTQDSHWLPGRGVTPRRSSP